MSTTTLVPNEVITAYGELRQVHVCETYKGFNIIDTGGVIQVHDPKHETLFIVALDDSKTCGHRVMVAEANNVATARKYINWLRKSKGESNGKATA
jgi:hypothetical protein